MTTTPHSFTRRGLGRICAGWLLGRRLLRAGESGPLTWAAQMELSAGLERRYRADAQIILLSIPVLRRKDVGDGSATWRESAAEGGIAIRLLEFTGRSAPERAAGLNRFGLVQELSRNSDRAPVESLYFGLMTASPEESAAEARKALHSNAEDASYSAIEGRIAAGCIETASARFTAPVRTSPVERNELIERARQALSLAPKSKVEWHSTGEAPRPFLHALAGLLNQPGSSETRYAYNGRVYHLRVARSADAKAASFFREQRLIPAKAGVTRISAWLCREEGGTPSEFRLWIEEGTPLPLPLRIEYRPKSYLRLMFEAQA
jgi:hypothetical protein